MDRLESLANNFAAESPYWGLSPQEWRKFININHNGVFLEDTISPNPDLDPGLVAAGVSIRIRSWIEDWRPINQIVFEKGVEKGVVSCVHTIISSYIAGEIPDEEVLAKAASESTMHDAELPLQEHFMALRSVVIGWNEIGWFNALSLTYQDGDPSVLPCGMNHQMQQQIISAITRVAPHVACDLVGKLLQDVEKFHPEERNKRWHLYKDRFNLELLVKCDRNLLELVLELFNVHSIDSYFYYDLIQSNVIPVTPKLLEELTRSHDYKFRAFAAGHYSTPLEALEELVKKEDDFYVLTALCRNPNVPPSILEQLASHKDIAVRSAVASSPKTPVYVLEKLALEDEEEIWIALCKNPAIPPQIAEEAVVKAPKCFSEYLTLNKNTPPSVLRKLAESESLVIRMNVALNPATPSDVLDSLANAKEWVIKECVIKHPNTLPSTLAKICESDTSYNIQVALSKNKHRLLKELWHILTNSPYIVVRENMQEGD